MAAFDYTEMFPLGPDETGAIDFSRGSNSSLSGAG